MVNGGFTRDVFTTIHAHNVHKAFTMRGSGTPKKWVLECEEYHASMQALAFLQIYRLIQKSPGNSPDDLIPERKNQYSRCCLN